MTLNLSENKNQKFEKGSSSQQKIRKEEFKDHEDQLDHELSIDGSPRISSKIC